ncbi:MAG: hypothetical protein WBP59_02780 [Ilumatobacteraceae bacterium]
MYEAPQYMDAAGTAEGHNAARPQVDEHHPRSAPTRSWIAVAVVGVVVAVWAIAMVLDPGGSDPSREPFNPQPPSGGAPG